MNRNDYFSGNGHAPEEAVPDADLRSLFMRTTPDLGGVDVDALLASVAGRDEHAGKLPARERPPRRIVESSAADLRLRDYVNPRPEWRAITKKRIAAGFLASVSIAALLLTLWHSRANSAFAAVQESLGEVRSVTFDLSSHGGNGPVEVVHVMLLGRDRGRLEYDDGFTVFDRAQRQVMNVTHDERKAVIFTNTAVEGENSIPNLFVVLLGASEESVEELGDREINGKVLRGFVVEFRGRELDVWVDPTTNLPVRIEQRHQLAEQPPPAIDPKIRQTRSVEAGTVIETTFAEFVYNPELDPAQFRIEPPEGHQVEMREAPPVE